MTATAQTDPTLPDHLLAVVGAPLIKGVRNGLFIGSDSENVMQELHDLGLCRPWFENCDPGMRMDEPYFCAAVLPKLHDVRAAIAKAVQS